MRPSTSYEDQAARLAQVPRMRTRRRASMRHHMGFARAQAWVLQASSRLIKPSLPLSSTKSHLPLPSAVATVVHCRCCLLLLSAASTAAAAVVRSTVVAVLD
ncbi:hypothetical protein GW17_00017534 [Ensete ventricosum]|nr:hypothetical protein GW17_00017534 [Ensete ventricosum]